MPIDEDEAERQAIQCDRIGDAICWTLVVLFIMVIIVNAIRR